MNRLELRIVNFQREDDPVRFRVELYADNALVAPTDNDTVIDCIALTQAALSDGGFYIVTCTCSDPGCAGIYQPVLAKHGEQVCTWTFATYGGDPVLTFDRSSFVQQALASLQDLRRRVPDDTASRLGNFPLGPATFNLRRLDWCIKSLAAGRPLSDPYA